VSPGELQNTFYDKRDGHEHEALDIPAPRGTPVVAAVEGNVIKLFTSKQGGLTVYQFDNSREYCYYYAHLDHYAAGITEGTLLRKGQVLGYVGTTGDAPPDAPHLHFAIFRLGPEKAWWKGTALDPLPLLR
jgi:murein DD-endopeptidase MepM/ murein hydrolase activator NlpD